MCEVFSIKVTTTFAYSLWSNSLCEHHNQCLTNILDQILDDAKCDYDTAQCKKCPNKPQCI